MPAPNAADWLEAIGTIGALLVGMSVLVREQRDRRRSQARQVNAWATDIRPKRTETELGVRVGMEGQCVVVQALNSSPEPVYEFHAWVHHDLSAESSVTGSMERLILAPGAHTIFVDGINIPASVLAHMPNVDVTFRDSGGRRWQRVYSGRLSPDRTSPDGRSASMNYRLRRWSRRMRL